MPFSIFNTKYFPIICFVGLFVLCLLLWESVVRTHYNPSLNIEYEEISRSSSAVDLPDSTDKSRRWYIVGNCLLLHGLSPEVMLTEWHALRPAALLPYLVNLARHEHPPQAYLTYLEKKKIRPEALIVNVSSWINSTNFEREAQLIERSDPLIPQAPEGNVLTEAFVGPGANDQPGFRKRTEEALSNELQNVLKLTEKRYHLFDFGAFLWTFLRSRDLRSSLYDLNLQSWFKIAGTRSDGLGYTGVEVRYNSDWETGIDTMVSKQLKRLRAAYFLTPDYWRLLELQLREVQAHGTKVLLIRMPEHPEIYKFNEERYRVSERMTKLSKELGAAFLDLNGQESLTGVKLYDAVHIDRKSSVNLSGFVARWLAETHPDWVFSSRR